MTLDEFLSCIYANVQVGTKVLIPRRKTDILEVRQDGEIVYLIKDSYKKTLSRQELEHVFHELERGPVKTSVLRRITTPSRPCNVSTIKWILEYTGLAHENPDRSWLRSWG